MRLDRSKIDLQMAREGLTVSELAKRYGCSRTRIAAILNSTNLLPYSAGKLADALGVDVAELVADQESSTRRKIDAT